MSKKKRHGHGPVSLGGGPLVGAFAIRIPKELSLPSLVDASGLFAVQDKIVALEREVVSLRKEARRPPAEVVPQIVIRTLSQVATDAWRAKVKMVDVNTGEPREDMRRVYRHIDAIFDALKALGIEAIDPVGRKYDSGMALKVISFEETPGLSREEIKETVKPSISWQGRLIQMGEVIVGTPVQGSNVQGVANEQNNH